MKTGTELRREALQEVENCVCRDRQNSYGDAESNFAVIAEFWSTYLRTRGLIAPGARIESFDVAELSGLIKTARTAHNPRHRDNWIDKAGYAICGAGIVARDAENAVAAANAVIGDDSGCMDIWTYRTKRPPGYFLPKPTSYAEALNAEVKS